MSGYKTITASGEAEFTIQRSRFITHTAPIQNEAEAQAFLQQIKKHYYDARHSCSAWVLGPDGSRQHGTWKNNVLVATRPAAQ